MGERLGNFILERPVPSFQFRKMRLHGHVGGLLRFFALTLQICHGTDGKSTSGLSRSVARYGKTLTKAVAALAARGRKSDTYPGVDAAAAGGVGDVSPWANDPHDQRGRTRAAGDAGAPAAGASGPGCRDRGAAERAGPRSPADPTT